MVFPLCCDAMEEPFFMASFIIFYAQELGLLKKTKIIQTMVKDLKQGLSRDGISVQSVKNSFVFFS